MGQRAEFTVLWLLRKSPVRERLSRDRFQSTYASIANLHITTAGHGYASSVHVDHNSEYFVRYVDCINVSSRNESVSCHHGIFVWTIFSGHRPAFGLFV